MAAAASGKVVLPVSGGPRRSKRPRNQQSANAVTDRTTVSKSRRCSESPSRRLWIMAESLLVRTKVLEQLDRDCSQGGRPNSVSLPNVSIPPKEDANRSLHKILEAALTRVSVLEKRRDISYCCAFKASTGKECIVRGCGGVLSAQHTVRHLRTTSTPEHQVAAIVLQQTECLECNQRWKTPSGLAHHETTVHGEAYTSRMEIFRPIFEQTASLVDGNRLTQSSHSKSHNVILNPTSPSNITVPPPVDSASASPTPLSDSEFHRHPQTPVYCLQPDWPESNDFNAFTNPVSANPAPLPASISEPQPSTYHPRPEWSEPVEFQPLTDSTSAVFAQLPPSAPVSYLQLDWSNSNDFNPWTITPANSTHSSRPEPGSLSQDPTGRQQQDWSWYNDPQHPPGNPLTTSSQV